MAERQAEIAVSKAVNGLNSATAPIVRQMTTLLTQLRNNPPRTEAAAQAINSQIQALSNQLNVAIDLATNAAGGVARSDQFLAAAALLQIEGIALYAAGLQGAQVMTGGTGDGATGPGPGVSRRSTGPVIAAQFALKEVLASPDMLRGMQLIGLEAEELRVISNEGNGYAIAGMIQSEIGAHLATQGTGVAKAFFAEVQASVLAAQQEAARIAAETKQRAAEEGARKAAEAQRNAAAAKAAAEAKLKDTANSLRSYDITGGQIAVVGAPDTVLPPGMLQTLPGEPVVTRVGDRVITTWVETMVNVLNTAHGGVSSGGTVTRTEIAGPEGTTTTLVFNIMFVDPMVTMLVPHVGGPLVSLEPGKPGTVQVTHRAPDGKTTVSYPDNADNKPASVAVTEGEVEIVGRGRVRAGEMLASTGTPVRVPGLITAPSIKAADHVFGSTDKAVEEGLYVWVRDGAVRVTKDAESVDVAAGNAAVVTDRVRLLDVVPNFLRFDGTPRPLPGGSGSVIDTFRAGDGAILNMCGIK